MKLRIQDNLLRLRLTQSEVTRLSTHGLIESAIQFPTGRELSYCVASLPDATEVSVDYLYDSIFVVVPTRVVTNWATGSQVSIEGPANSSVHILIEKDFQCLHKPVERDPDAWPNPLAVHKRRPAA